MKYTWCCNLSEFYISVFTLVQLGNGNIVDRTAVLIDRDAACPIFYPQILTCSLNIKQNRTQRKKRRAIFLHKLILYFGNKRENSKFHFYSMHIFWSWPVSSVPCLSLSLSVWSSRHSHSLLLLLLLLLLLHLLLLLKVAASPTNRPNIVWASKSRQSIGIQTILSALKTRPLDLTRIEYCGKSCL